MKNKKVFVIGGIVLGVIVIAVVGVLLLGGAPLIVSVSMAGEATSESAPVPEPTSIVLRPDPASVPPAAGIMVDLGSKVINLADPGGYRLLRVGLVLEFSPTSYTYYSAKPEEKTQEEEHVRNEVAVQRPIIDDTTIGILSNKTFGDVFSLQGKEDLKEELRQAINARLENLEVLRVYVTDFLVQ